jgi:hypothetical protein
MQKGSPISELAPSRQGDSSTCKCGLGARLCWFCTERAQNTYLNNQCRALPYSGLVARVPRQEEQGAGEGRGRSGRAGIGVPPVGSSAYDGELLTFASQLRKLLFSQLNATSRFPGSYCGPAGRVAPCGSNTMTSPQVIRYRVI